MKTRLLVATTLTASTLAMAQGANAGQPPTSLASPDIPISHRDRVYAAEQYSNTVSVTDPSHNKLLGVIKLGDPAPSSFSPLYRGQVLVHGMGFSPDHRTLAVVSIGSNSVTFIDTQTNAVKHTTYVGRSPHEAFYTPDGSEVWVTVRGENYISVLDAKTYEEKTRVTVPAGPGMQIFSPDGRYGYVCSSFTPETVVISTSDYKIVGRIKQESPFCPNIAATADGKQVWFTLKDIGKVQVFEATPPFAPIRSLDTGPLTNHVNFIHRAKGTFAYVTIGSLNQVKVFRTDTFESVATIPVGKLPHGLWPSGDGTRMYVGLENDDALAVIDTSTNKLVSTIPIGQAPQALTYVPNAVLEGDGTQNLQPLGLAGQTTHLTLTPVPTGAAGSSATPTNVTLFDQGLVQVLQASVNGLQARQPYVLALSENADGSGPLESLANFMTNPAGAAIVNAIGQIRQVVTDAGSAGAKRRYLVIAPVVAGKPGTAVQTQTP